MFDCAPVFCLPACFSPSGWFMFFICFILLLKDPDFLCIWVLDLISRDNYVTIPICICQLPIYTHKVLSHICSVSFSFMNFYLVSFGPVSLCLIFPLLFSCHGYSYYQFLVIGLISYYQYLPCLLLYLSSSFPVFSVWCMFASMSPC